MIKIISDLVEMRSLEREWNELAESFKTPLLRHEWFDACAEAFYLPDQLHVIIKYSETGIDAIAPLILEQSWGVKRIEFMGAAILCEPNGFMYRDEKSLEELIYFVLKMKKAVSLRRLQSDSPEVITIRKMNKKASFIIFKEGKGSLFIPITDTWAQFEANMSSRRRYDLRRARKRAEKFGDLHFEIKCPDPENLDSYLEEVFRVEAAGWKGRKGTALLFDERLRRFFILYSRAASRLGILRLCFLKINDRPVAVLMAVETFNRFWALKLGYDEKFYRSSPGILLMHETIHYAFQAGLEAYEFLGSDDPWIQMWTDQKHSYVTTQIYPLSISGQYRLAQDIILEFAKKVSKKCIH